MRLNDMQRRIVEENVGLVGVVLRERVWNVMNVGIYTYDDLFQYGCIGLCKAAYTDKGSGARFSTYAYRLILNEIYSALEYATLRREREPVTDLESLPGGITATASPDTDLQADLGVALAEAKQKAGGITAKGIEAIELMQDGYTCREIGRMMGAPPSHITAWVSRARKFLRARPAIVALGAQ